MEKKVCVMIISVVLVLLQLSKPHVARLLLTEEEIREKKSWAWTTQGNSSSQGNEEYSILMGEEKCDEKDEECVKRRMTAEAHLDYIYTQHHNP